MQKFLEVSSLLVEGVEGCEFACLFSGLGSQVTLVEMMPKVLSMEDEDTMAILTRELKKRKVQLYLNATIQDWEFTADGIHATLSTGESVISDKMLISVGRRMNSGGIGLEAVGVQTGSREEIVVDEHMETSIPGVYAIGDVTGEVHAGACGLCPRERWAASNAMGTTQSINYDVIPAGIFTLPEIGRVGLTEQQARERGVQTTIGRFRYGGIGKAQGRRRNKGAV